MHVAVDDIGESSLEAAHGFAVGLSFSTFASVVGAAFGVGADLGECDGEEGAVELPVAAGVVAMPDGAPGRGRDGCGAVGCSEGLAGGVAADVDDLGQESGSDEWSDAVLLGEAGAGGLDELVDVAFELGCFGVDRDGSLEAPAGEL